MLTPPGLKGKQYRISGKAYPRLSRPGQKRRRVLQVLAAVVAVAVLGWGTVQLVTVFGGKKKPVAAAKNCAHQASAAGGGDAAKPSASASASAMASGTAAPIALPSGVPQPATITVNVYNATSHVGLAGQTAAQLKLRGFKIGLIANAPAAMKNKITGSAQVTGATTNRAALSLLGSEVSGATTTTDARKDTTVDFFVGNGFTALLTPAQVAQALALAASPSASAGAHC